MGSLLAGPAPRSHPGAARRDRARHRLTGAGAGPCRRGSPSVQMGSRLAGPAPGSHPGATRRDCAGHKPTAANPGPSRCGSLAARMGYRLAELPPGSGPRTTRRDRARQRLTAANSGPVRRGSLAARMGSRLAGPPPGSPSSHGAGGREGRRPALTFARARGSGRARKCTWGVRDLYVGCTSPVGPCSGPSFGAASARGGALRAAYPPRFFRLTFPPR